MLTFKKTINTPRLVISYDNDTESPRQWDNLGYFITVDSRHYSPDQNEEFQAIVKATGDEANSVENHMTLIKQRIDSETEEKVLAIYPIVKYEHGGISYSLGHKIGFDYSNNGFYIVTKRTADILGTPKNRFEKVIGQELEEYNSYVNGEVYRFTLYDEHGEEMDACGGFNDIEDILGHLPEEFKDEKLAEYFNHNN